MKKILVMMSTYNGAKYLQEQIESILTQTGVQVFLSIRDDGSTDNTQNILRKYEKNNNIEVIYGKNLGYANSFWTLVMNSKEFDYYAFADQDDVWKKNKLFIAINYLEKIQSQIKMYASSMDVVDEKLKFMYKHEFPKLKTTLGSSIVRQRLAGCTMVFSPSLIKMAKMCNINETEVNLAHDGTMYYICLALGGKVFFDKDSYIYYRRHANTVTNKGKKIINKITPYFYVFNKDRGRKCSEMTYLNKFFENYYGDEEKKLIEEVLNYKKSFCNTLKLLFDSKCDSGDMRLNLIFKLAVLTHSL